MDFLFFHLEFFARFCPSRNFEMHVTKKKYGPEEARLAEEKRLAEEAAKKKAEEEAKGRG